jgi:hypothetical protein
MQLVRFFADHKPSSIRKRDIIFRVPHLHVLCLEVAIHHEASHEKVFAEIRCGSVRAAISEDTPILVLSPIFGYVNSGLRAQSAKYGH